MVDIQMNRSWMDELMNGKRGQMLRWLQAGQMDKWMDKQAFNSGINE